MKYRLTEDWLEYKKGQVFDGIPSIPLYDHPADVESDEAPYIDYRKVTFLELSLLLKTGILEEVKEEEWPKVGHGYWYIGWSGMVYQDIWSQGVHEESAKVFGNIFHSKTEALEASEKIKTLLLSLKK